MAATKNHPISVADEIRDNAAFLDAIGDRLAYDPSLISKGTYAMVVDAADTIKTRFEELLRMGTPS